MLQYFRATGLNIKINFTFYSLKKIGYRKLKLYMWLPLYCYGSKL